MLYVHDITRATFEKCHYSGNAIFVGILFILSNSGKFPPFLIIFLELRRCVHSLAIYSLTKVIFVCTMIRI